MKLIIEISYNDFKEICNTLMTIDDMYNTLNGRLYCAIAKAANSKESTATDNQ